MKSGLPDEQKWHPQMPVELRLPVIRYSRSQFTCRADFPPHMLERSGAIMQQRSARIERQQNARAKVLQLRREWWAARELKSLPPPPPENHPATPDAEPATMSIQQLLTRLRRSNRATRKTLNSVRRGLRLINPEPRKAA